MRFDKKTIIKYLLLFISLLMATVFFLFKGEGLLKFVNIIKTMDMRYMVIGLLCGFCFIFCEATNLRILLNKFGYKVSILSTLKYAFTGFFFSSVTPSASGGQPMQVYSMKKDKISISHSTLALLVELVVFQFITLIIGLIGIALYGSELVMRHKSFYLLAILGVLLNITIICILLLAMFKSKILISISDFILRILVKFKMVKDENKLIDARDNYIKEFSECAILIRKYPLAIVSIVVVTTIQLVVKYTVPFWVYKGFGFHGYTIVQFILMQGILSLTVSSLPLPGAVGVSEGGFTLLFASLFPKRLINTAALVSRGLSFYLLVVTSGIIALSSLFLANRNKNKVVY